jgi:zinc-ribbon domain
MTDLIKCKACGQDISPEARVCIHCGHPLKKRNYTSAIISAAVIISFAVAVLLGWSLLSIPGGLPTCDSTDGQAGAQQAIEKSPSGKTLGITILSIKDTKTISYTNDKVECKATVILNSAKTGIMDYSFTNNSSLGNGTYLIRASFEIDSFKTIP